MMKKPKPEKKFEIITRNTLGSNGLYTNFTSLSHSKNNFSYYGFVNYKKEMDLETIQIQFNKLLSEFHFQNQ